ncbi:MULTISPECIES: putative DNA-binding domain-containing protein [unclassified Erwinia]|uniref:HvfC/BufC family peptide modification chaperone n=1 Tax=unclassified Erwinia TaxID=2622719 RepID=UPI0006F9BE3F|nr:MULTISPECIES: putative DNA-binding domain-containing protein [unclassified Erwinia]KQN60269.1 hypothetical protein ASF13_22275 [Erwinia sp. Leaf53]PLV60588.1 hypothetical protein NV64_12615 [Erwinia sp. B116]
MSQPPRRIAQLIRNFSAQLREKEGEVFPTAVRNYRAFLRGSVSEVIGSSFPQFSQQAGPQRIKQLAARFLEEHGAEEAEFHHIATEFVHFIHRTHAVSRAECQLIEYEWVLLAVEIDPAEIPLQSADHHDPATPLAVTINPTLNCIQFSGVFSDEGGYQINEGQLPCGIFRNRHHKVVKKRLTAFDGQMLHLIVDQQLCLVASLEQALNASDARYLGEWLNRNQEIDFISLQTR